MPLWTPPPFAGEYANSAKTLTTITAHATINTKGTWTSVVASTGKDAFGFWTVATGMSVTATLTGGLMDIGVGPTDPPAIVVPDWDVGWAPTTGAACPRYPKMQYWPIFIPAGSKIWARLAAAITVDTCLVKVILDHGQPYGDHLTQDATAYGVVTTGSRGTVCTSGAGVYGTAVSLGTTTKDHAIWALGCDGGTDTTLVSLGDFFAQICLASNGDGTIGEYTFNVETTTEMVGGPFPPMPLWQPVASGTTIYGRISAPATSDSLALIAYGM
jgi:hypothetical protein